MNYKFVNIKYIHKKIKSSFDLLKITFQPNNYLKYCSEDKRANRLKFTEILKNINVVLQFELL